MKQRPVTPKVLPCWCGSKARVDDWYDTFQYRVMCARNHTLTKECGSVHRAVCLWNNRVTARAEQESSNDKHD